MINNLQSTITNNLNPYLPASQSDPNSLPYTTQLITEGITNEEFLEPTLQPLSTNACP